MSSGISSEICLNKFCHIRLYCVIIKYYFLKKVFYVNATILLTVQELQALYEQEVAICTLYLIKNLRIKPTKVKKV